MAKNSLFAVHVHILRGVALVRDSRVGSEMKLHSKFDHTRKLQLGLEVKRWIKTVKWNNINNKTCFVIFTVRI